jgi:hypothetical protein
VGAGISPTTESTAETGNVGEHLDRLLKSDLLRRSASLCHLLQYLVEKALQADGEHIKESVIAIDVFHRSGEFDSRIDNIVRVHAHRLRKILDTWYAGEGAGDRIRFVMPKGNYMLRIEPNGPRADAETVEEAPAPDLVMVTGAKPAAPPVAQQPEAMSPAPVRTRALATRPVLIWAALIGGIAIGSAGTWLSLRRLEPPANDILMRPPLSALWKNVFRHGTDTVVSFTNPTFLRTSGSPRVYVTYNGPLNAANGAEVNVAPAPPLDKRLAPLGPFFFSDSWTGTGEIIAMHKLTELAADSGYHVRPVRSRALTYNDVRNANVIFIGSSWANDMQTKFNLGQMPFQCFGTEKIVNKRPAPGEPSAWYAEPNPATNELAASYALFSVLPGAGPGAWMVSSSGIDTYSTMAALDLMTTPNGVLDLMRHFGTAERQTLPDYFQAVIRTEVIRGEPARSSVVAVRAVAGK